MASELPEEGLDELPDDCCAKCRFAQHGMREKRNGYYHCRRYPPVIPVSVEIMPHSTNGSYNASTDCIDGVGLTSYPGVKSADWCGEFQRGEPGVDWYE